MGFPKSHAGQTWSRLASGIEAGIVGGAAMLGLLISDSLWSGHVWWEFPNLLGSTFYGTRAFRSGTGLATLSGAALHFVITGTLGALFGLSCGGIQQRGRLLLLGMLAAVGWYNIANALFWPRVNPWVPLASPRPATLVAHALLGVCLGYMGQRLKVPADGSQASHAEPPPVPAEPYLSLTGPAEPLLAGSQGPMLAGSGEPSPTGSSEPSPTGSGEHSPTGSSEPSLTGSSGPAATSAPDALE
jgi:hypothetical protein